MIPHTPLNGILALTIAGCTTTRTPPIEPRVDPDVTAKPQCPVPGSVLVAGGKIKFFPGAELAGAHMPYTDVLRASHYTDTYDVEPFCLDRDEVTVGEYFDCVSRGHCTVNSTPLWVDMNLWIDMNDASKDLIKKTATGDVIRSSYLADAAPNYIAWRVRDGGFDHTRYYRICPIDPKSADGMALLTPVQGDKSKLAMGCVTYADAMAFCKDKKGRLPTATEWERAAGGTASKVRREFPWGSEEREPLDVALPLDPHGGRDADMPVGSHPRDTTPQGIHDLYGNVLEWTDPAPVKVLVDAMMQHPVTASLPCNSCTATTTEVAFGMGRTWVGSGDARKNDSCDLCEAQRYTKDFRSPVMGFRCAYDRAQ